MLLWNLFLRNNEVILYDSVQVVTFSFCMWPFTAVCVCVCVITSDKWKEKKNCTLDPYSEGSIALVRYEALLLGFCLLRAASGSQTVDDHGRKKNGLRQISDFYRKQTKKVHSYFVSLQRCIQLKFKFISPSHPIPGLLHYSHESSLKSFSFPPTSQHHLHPPLSNRSAIVPPERVQTISSSALNLLSPSCPSVALFSIVVPPSADRQ